MKKNFFKVEDEVLYSAVEEFGRNKKSFDEDVETVKEWLQKQPHLPEVLEKRCLQNFLLLNKCSIEKTKQTIDMYFTVRTKLEDIFTEINPKLPNMKELRDIEYWVIHPKTFENGRIFIFKMRQENMGEKLEPINLLRHFLNIQEIRMKEDVTCGDFFIIDCRYVPISYTFKLTPTFFHKAVGIIYEKLYSMRLRGVYFIHFPKFAEAALNIVKKIIKPKLSERFKICPDLESLKEVFPEEVLPVEFGGVGYTFEQLREILEEKFIEYQPWYDHLDTLRVDERLRPESLKDDDLLGFHGNFKKLDVD